MAELTFALNVKERRRRIAAAATELDIPFNSVAVIGLLPIADLAQMWASINGGQPWPKPVVDA